MIKKYAVLEKEINDFISETNMLIEYNVTPNTHERVDHYLTRADKNLKQIEDDDIVSEWADRMATSEVATHGWISLTNDWMDYCNEAIRLDMSSESKDRDIMSYLSDGLFLAAQEKYEDEIVGLRKILEKVRDKC